MPQIKFGTEQLGNPTPHRVSMLFDFLAGACGIIAGFLATAAFIPNSVSNVLSSVITALIIPLLLLAKRFFGVEKEDKNVHIDNVVEMDTPKKDDT